MKTHLNKEITPLFHTDSNNLIQSKEMKNGFISYIKISIYSLFGYRNYDIVNVLKTLITSNKKLSNHQIEIICDKVAKK